MSKIKPLFIFAVAVTGAMMFSGDCLAQGCPGCAQASPTYVGYSGACDSCGSQGCRSGGHQARREEFHAKIDHAKSINAKVCARNAAWPKPFDCADRQLYFSMWGAMIDQGFEEQCVLNASHFDPATNELNSFGLHTVSGIMQNMPSNRKEVFVHREADATSNDQRMAAVKKTIDTFYGQSGPARVSFSTKLPVTLRGEKAEAIMRLGGENRPTPIIPISSGDTVGSAVGG